MPPTPFRGNSNNMTYDLVDGWNTWAYQPSYSNVMLPISKVEPLTKTAAPEIYAMAKIIKVEAMHRVSDIFGPIIYSKYRNVNPDLGVDFDSQQAAYTAFFSVTGYSAPTPTLQPRLKGTILAKPSLPNFTLLATVVKVEANVSFDSFTE